MKKYVLALVFVFGLFVFNIESCFAASTEIPGFSGSGMASIADLSSAVFKPTKYDINRCVAVCVKEVYKSGRERDRGVWYFMYYGNSHKVGVKENESSEFRTITTYGPYGDEVLHNFMMELIDAAEANRNKAK